MGRDWREVVPLRDFRWHPRERDMLEIFPVCHRTGPRRRKRCRKRRGEFCLFETVLVRRFVRRHPRKRHREI